MDWNKPLEAAVSAAREAGEMLRREFYREGGPRGEVDHAEVDTQAERAIRDRLHAAFPEFGFLGEETGRERGRDADTCWLVDPNDGTVPFLQGLRGFSVS